MQKKGDRESDFLDIVDVIIDKEFPFKNEADKNYAHRVVENTRRLNQLNEKINRDGANSLSQDELDFVFDRNIQPGSDRSTRFGNRTLFSDGKKERIQRQIGLKTCLNAGFAPNYKTLGNVISDREIIANIDQLSEVSGEAKDKIVGEYLSNDTRKKNFNILLKKGISVDYLVNNTFSINEIFNQYDELHDKYGYNFDFKKRCNSEFVKWETDAYLSHLGLFIKDGCTPEELNEAFGTREYIEKYYGETVRYERSEIDKYITSHITEILSDEKFAEHSFADNYAPYIVRYCNEQLKESMTNRWEQDFPRTKPNDKEQLAEKVNLIKTFLKQGGDPNLVASAFKRGEFYKNDFYGSSFIESLIENGMDIEKLKNCCNGGYEYIDDGLIDNLPKYIEMHKDSKDDVQKALNLYQSSHHMGALRDDLPKLFVSGVSKEQIDDLYNKEQEQREIDWWERWWSR